MRIQTLEMHTGGEPLRVFTSGLPSVEGRTVLDKVRYFRDHYDYIRTGTIWEPRGHADMYGAILTPSLDADFDVFFLHNEGYSTMCGHAIIALTTLAIEAGLVRRPNNSHDSMFQVTFNVPAGRIEARGRLEEGKACDVTFRNVPAFLYLRDQQVEVPGIGGVRFDVAYGGAFYALVDARPLGLELIDRNLSQLIDFGRRIKHAAIGAFTFEHPFEKDLSFLYGTIFTGPAHQRGHHSRNVCIFADGEVDRSATGSGVSARAALHYAKGELRLNETITIESIVNSTMTVQAVEQTQFGPHQAVVPEVSGTAFITGRSEFYFDPADPLVNGFILR
jgi:trans-L-3-hydroxyproline dehydratase